MKGAKRIPEKKLQTVKAFEQIIDEYPIVGIVDMENLPAKQLQNMREQLRGTVDIIMTKKRLIRVVLEDMKTKKPGIEKLLDYIRGMPAMVFTKENPFRLYKKLNDNKSSAPAKAGQTASNDIYVLAGPTPFSPGPIIGELGSLGIKSGIEGGKVEIKKDTLVVKEGQKISANIASILTRLGIEPMEIGLNLVAVFEEGSVFTKDVLDIDEEGYLRKIGSAAGESLCLAVGIGYATEDTIKILLQKAYNDAKAIGMSQKIIADELVNELLARAECEMQGLIVKLNIQMPIKESGQKDNPGTGKDDKQDNESEIKVTDK